MSLRRGRMPEAPLISAVGIDKDFVAFVSASAIWRISPRGGEARRCTPDLESAHSPVPNARTGDIAFSGGPSGQVFLSRKGKVSQITFLDRPCQPLTWTADSKIVFRSAAA